MMRYQEVMQLVKGVNFLETLRLAKEVNFLMALILMLEVNFQVCWMKVVKVRNLLEAQKIAVEMDLKMIEAMEEVVDLVWVVEVKMQEVSHWFLKEVNLQAEEELAPAEVSLVVDQFLEVVVN